MKYVIAFDPGLTGGITVLDEEQKIIECVPIPTIKISKGNSYNLPSIISTLENYEDKVVFIEEQHVKFGNGIKASFTTGELYGLLKGILIAKKIPFEIVKAIEWQKKLFAGQIVKDTKAASWELCRNKYPEFDFTPTDRAKKTHSGMTDSLCIALYGSLKYK